MHPSYTTPPGTHPLAPTTTGSALALDPSHVRSALASALLSALDAASPAQVPAIATVLADLYGLRHAPASRGVTVRVDGGSVDVEQARRALLGE